MDVRKYSVDLFIRRNVTSSPFNAFFFSLVVSSSVVVFVILERLIAFDCNWRVALFGFMSLLSGLSLKCVRFHNFHSNSENGANRMQGKPQIVWHQWIYCPSSHSISMKNNSQSKWAFFSLNQGNSCRFFFCSVFTSFSVEDRGKKSVFLFLLEPQSKFEIRSHSNEIT